MNGAYFQDACSALDRDRLVKRLADHLWHNPVREYRPGVCQVCGHALPVAYRAVRFHDGKCKTLEVAPGSEEQERLEAKIRDGSYVNGTAHGWWIMDVRGCDALGPEWVPEGVSVWTEARAIVAEGKKELKRRELGLTDQDEDSPAMRTRKRAIR